MKKALFALISLCLLFIIAVLTMEKRPSPQLSTHHQAAVNSESPLVIERANETKPVVKQEERGITYRPVDYIITEAGYVPAEDIISEQSEFPGLDEGEVEQLSGYTRSWTDTSDLSPEASSQVLLGRKMLDILTADHHVEDEDLLQRVILTKLRPVVNELGAAGNLRRDKKRPVYDEPMLTPQDSEKLEALANFQKQHPKIDHEIQFLLQGQGASYCGDLHSYFHQLLSVN